MLGLAVLSILAGMGMAIVLVEKGDKGPLKPVTEWLKVYIPKIPYLGKHLDGVLDCAVCASLWTTLFADIVVGVVTQSYFARRYLRTKSSRATRRRHNRVLRRGACRGRESWGYRPSATR